GGVLREGARRLGAGTPHSAESLDRAVLMFLDGYRDPGRQSPAYAGLKELRDALDALRRAEEDVRTLADFDYDPDGARQAWIRGTDAYRRGAERVRAALDRLVPRGGAADMQSRLDAAGGELVARTRQRFEAILDQLPAPSPDGAPEDPRLAALRQRLDPAPTIRQAGTLLEDLTAQLRTLWPRYIEAIPP